MHPDATEVCDDEDTDEDCDGLADDADDSVDSETFETWYADEDLDGYGDPDAPLQACDPPEDSSTDATDCDDTDAGVNPAASEVEDDGIDQDCDGADAESPSEEDSDDTDSDGVSDGDGKGGSCATSSPATPTISFVALGLLGLEVAVGTALSDRTNDDHPAQIRTSGTTADGRSAGGPALGDGGKSLVRPWVTDPRGWEPTGDQPAHLRP